MDGHSQQWLIFSLHGPTKYKGDPWTLRKLARGDKIHRTGPVGRFGEKIVFNFVLNFRRVTHFRLCLLETQVLCVHCLCCLGCQWQAWVWSVPPVAMVATSPTWPSGSRATAPVLHPVAATVGSTCSHLPLWLRGCFSHLAQCDSGDPIDTMLNVSICSWVSLVFNKHKII